MTFVLWASPRRLLQAQRYSKEGRLLYGGPGRDYGNNPDYEQGLTAAQEGEGWLHISLRFSVSKIGQIIAKYENRDDNEQKVSLIYLLHIEMHRSL